MNHFEYVMVLISIIIGLGIAHILLGLGGIIDRLTGRGDRLRLSLAHGPPLHHDTRCHSLQRPPLRLDRAFRSS